MNGKIDYNELIGEGEKGMVSVFQEHGMKERQKVLLNGE